ncbi:MAG: stringent starvation protein B, partial [Methylococcales bacterium]
PEAIQHLVLGNSEIGFHARFGGVSMHVEIPVSAVLAIYARENGQGMVFENEENSDPPTSPAPSAPEKSKPRKPTLKVVK